MSKKRKHFLALSLAGIGAIGAFASVSAATLHPGTPKTIREQVRTAIKDAFTTDDYQTYRSAIEENSPDTPSLTEIQFHASVKAQKLREEGDIESARKILEDAGIPISHGKGKHVAGVNKAK